MKLIIDINDKDFEIMKHNIAVNNPLCPISQKEIVTKIVNGTPLDHVFNTIKDGIKEEADYAYADFEQYKADVLNVEADELPDDDFRYGMERAIEIINAYKKAVNE